MKNHSFLPLVAFCLIIQPVFANDAELKNPDLSGLPNAFDAGWKGQKTCELLFEDETTRVGRCTFPPGVGHEKHYHRPHFGYVLEGGTLLILDNEGEHKVTTISNGSWSTTEITVHEAMNIGDTTTSYLIVEPKTP
jgi:quercetin dioxygenase-like cupin family protein